MCNKRRFFNSQELRYYSAEIGGANGERLWRALRCLCGLFNAGASIPLKNNREKQQLEMIIRGLCVGGKPSAKVLHWGMACLSHIGSADSREFISKIIAEHHDNPDVVSAGIAALFKIGGDNVKRLIKGNDPVFTALAALQVIKQEKLKKMGFPIPVINFKDMNTDSLKNALLLVGMNKAPENLFAPNHSNAELIKELSKHDDPIIVQYSIWAAAKNPSLKIKDIGIDLRDVDSFSDEIKEHIYTLIAQEKNLTSEHREIIIHGIEDENNTDILLGIASGLRRNYDSSLVDNIDSWYHDTQNPEVQAAILEHMAVNSEASVRYKEIVIDAYRRESADSQLRLRLKGSAKELPLFGELCKIDYESEGLFGNGGMQVTNNINGQNVNIGAFAAAGNASNSGTVQQVNRAELTGYLDKLKEEIAKQKALPEEKRKELLEAVAEAGDKPSERTLGKLKDKLHDIVSVCKDAENLAAFAGTVGSVYIPALAHFIAGLV